ncbi:MAG: hypothetical protein SVX38_00195 [Chloroflexota bacterium]|nr:hypothetical protein [Chloroflexota bacterium]
MAIRSTTLKNHGERYIIVMDGAQTLGDALQFLRGHGYQANQTYLVVAQTDQRHRVALFSELKGVVAMMGYDSFAQPLHALPLPFADRVESTDTPQSGQEVVDWVASNPQSTVVVIEGDQVVGLFANPNRSSGSGWLDNLSLLELHGELVQLGGDPRADFVARVRPPRCPHCQMENFFEFNPQQRVYICPHCGEAVGQS